MKVRFLGDPSEIAKGLPPSRTEITMYGVTFTIGRYGEPGEAVDVSHLSEEQRRRLAGNGHFEVVANDNDGPTPPEPRAARGRRAKADVVSAPEGEVVEDGE